MPSSKHVGYVLPEEHSSSMSLQVFPGFPGRFMPGEPLALMHMGIDEDEADALIAEQGLPLEKVELSAQKAKKAYVPDEMHARSGFEGEVVASSPEELAELSHAELDELADEAHVDVDGTIAEKAAALAAAGVEAPAEEAEG